MGLLHQAWTSANIPSEFPPLTSTNLVSRHSSFCPPPRWQYPCVEIYGMTNIDRAKISPRNADLFSAFFFLSLIVLSSDLFASVSLSLFGLSVFRFYILATSSLLWVFHKDSPQPSNDSSSVLFAIKSRTAYLWSCQPSYSPLTQIV